MNRLIPKALAYSRSVKALENRSYQKWLQDTIEMEDLIYWARGNQPYWDLPKTEPAGIKGFLSALLP